MNKYITSLLLAVVAIAMVMVVTFHMNGDRPVPGSSGAISGQLDADAAREAFATTASGTPSGAQSVGSLSEMPISGGVDLLAGSLNAGANLSPAGNAQPAQRSSVSSVAMPSETAQPTVQPTVNAAMLPPAGQNPAESTTNTSRPPALPTASRTSSTVQTSRAPAQPSGTSAAMSARATASSETAPRPATSPVSGTGTIRNISMHFKDKGMLIRFEADSALAVKSFVLTSPDRLVIDLPGNWKGLKVPDMPSNTLVKKVRLGRQGNADRIVLDLTRPLNRQTMTKTAEHMVEVVFE